MKYISEDYLLGLTENPERISYFGSRDVADAPGVEMLTCDECVFKYSSSRGLRCRNPLIGGLEFDVIYGAGLPCIHGIKRKAEIPEIVEETEYENPFK